MVIFSPCPIGTPGQQWGEAEKSEWRARQVRQRSYDQEIVPRIEALGQLFETLVYGHLDYAGAQYSLFALRSRIDPGNDGIVVALTGSFHARKRRASHGPAYPPAASLLPSAQTMTVLVRGNGGQNWSCRAGGCGVHESSSTGRLSRRLTLRPLVDDGYDADLDLGMATTASAPANNK